MNLSTLAASSSGSQDQDVVTSRPWDAEADYVETFPHRTPPADCALYYARTSLEQEDAAARERRALGPWRRALAWGYLGAVVLTWLLELACVFATSAAGALRVLRIYHP